MSFENIGAVWRDSIKKGKATGRTYFKGHIIVDGKKHPIVMMPFIRSKQDYDREPTKDPTYTISLAIKEEPVQQEVQKPKPAQDVQKKFYND